MTIRSYIKVLTYNILEEGEVTITNFDPGFSKERLFDRSLGFYCKYSSTSAFVVSIDQGSAILPVDTLIIEGHLLDTVTIDWQYSSNGSSWTTAETWTQSGNTQIVKNLAAPLTYQYWRVSMGSHQFQALEIFMGLGFKMPVVWENEPGLGEIDDIQKLRTYGGVDHSVRMGPKRKIRSYTLFLDRVTYNVDTLEGYLVYLDDYSKPVYLTDHEESTFLAWFDVPPKGSHMNQGLLTMPLSFTELAG